MLKKSLHHSIIEINAGSLIMGDSWKVASVAVLTILSIKIHTSGSIIKLILDWLDSSRLLDKFLKLFEFVYFVEECFGDVLMELFEVIVHFFEANWVNWSVLLFFIVDLLEHFGFLLLNCFATVLSFFEKNLHNIVALRIIVLIKSQLLWNDFNNGVVST